MNKPVSSTALFRLLPSFIALIGLAWSARPAWAQAPPPVKPAPVREKALADRLTSPRQNDRPLADKLRSPRETFKTLYYAVTLYDLFPEMMEDAIACLDLDNMQLSKPEDAIRLALDLEYVLQSLSL